MTSRTEAQRLAKVAIIDRTRDAQLAAGVEFNGEIWHADATFLSEMVARITAWSLGLYAADATRPVRTRDNKVISLGRDQHIAVAAAVGAYRETVYSQSWTAKDSLP